MSFFGSLKFDSQRATATSLPGVLAEPAVPVGRFHAWWRNDSLPALSNMPGLVIAPAADERLIGAQTGIGAVEVASRIERSHQPWMATLAGEPVGWGWCAAKEFSIGELGISRSLPPGNRYLWDFATAPPWRGRGIYPRMLQAIVTREAGAERFWLGHEMENVASARGISNAGFREVGVLYRGRDGGFVLVPAGPLRIAKAAAALFGVAVADQSAASGVRSTGDDVRVSGIR